MPNNVKLAKITGAGTVDNAVLDLTSCTWPGGGGSGIPSWAKWALIIAEGSWRFSPDSTVTVSSTVGPLLNNNDSTSTFSMNMKEFKFSQTAANSVLWVIFRK